MQLSVNICLAKQNVTITLTLNRKNLVGTNTGTLFGCSLCNLWLHHINSSWLRGRRHRVSYCKTATRCQLLSGQSSARWAEWLHLAAVKFKSYHVFFCLPLQCIRRHTHSVLSYIRWYIFLTLTKMDVSSHFFIFKLAFWNQCAHTTYN